MSTVPGSVPTACSVCPPGGRSVGTVSLMVTLPTSLALASGSEIGSENSVTVTVSFGLNRSKTISWVAPGFRVAGIGTSGLTVTWAADDGVGVGGVVGSLELVEAVVDVLVLVEVEVDVLVLDEAVLEELVVGVGVEVEVGVNSAPAK